jgi:hypothetical protein
MNIIAYISLGFEVFNAVTTLIAMVRTPALLNAAQVWAVVVPVLNEVAAVAHVKINFPVAKQVVTDAVDTIKAALGGKVSA